MRMIEDIMLAIAGEFLFLPGDSLGSSEVEMEMI